MAEDVALRKRQQISKANRTMFLWVAIASALIGFAAVVSYFMIQRIIFNQEVIGTQEDSLEVIKKNNDSVDAIKSKVRVLNTNETLIALRSNEQDEPAQVILDALPANPNSAALGASLQSEKLVGRPGVTIESMTVTPIQGVEDTAVDGAVSEDASIIGNDFPKIVFTFGISVPQEQADVLRGVLKDIERSIRAINIVSVKIESQGTKLIMNVEGEAYYEPAVSLDLTDKVVKPQ